VKYDADGVSRPHCAGGPLTSPCAVHGGKAKGMTMQQIQVKFLNLPEAPAEERFVAMVERAFGRARDWATSAVSFGLQELVPAEAAPLLEALLAQTRARDILSSGVSLDVVRMAEICSKRIAAQEAHSRRAQALSDQSVQLYSLAEAIDEALDLQAALLARERIWRI
jgi:hypothetical protein